MFGVKFFTYCFASSCAVIAATAPASADPLPECASDRWDINDCQIQSHDRLGLRFEKRHHGQTAEVRVLLPNGAVAQTIDQHTSESGLVGVLLVQDLDGDGRDDVLISTDSGGVHGNLSWALWRTTGNSTQFQHIGNTLGAVFWHAGDDLFAVWGSGPMRSWLTTVYRFENNQLVPIAAVQDDGFTSKDGQHRPCYLLKQYDLARYGLTPDTARDRFCASTHEHTGAL